MSRQTAQFRPGQGLIRYDLGSKGLVLAFEYADRLDLAPTFIQWLERVGRPLLPKADLNVPVRPHRRPLFSCRCNQSTLIA